MKRVLMVAFHFPPLAGSSGIQRTLRFARYLPEFGWQPIVLTVQPWAYAQKSSDQIPDISPETELIRAPAWDAARHLAIAGRYPAFLARPDRWMSWWPGGVIAGLHGIRKYRPAALWSTFPIATAHRIGASLAKHTSLPWIADFRDPMAQDGYPEDPKTWKSFAGIERRAIAASRFSTFTTPSAVQSYRLRYPEHAARIMLLENGFDEEVFADIPSGSALNPGKITLVHSGIVYPSERDPRHLFEALARLKKVEPEVFARLRIRFRAAVHETFLRELAEVHDIVDVIEVLPALAYREALSEMMAADGLLVLQASNCNAQIPAKLYEYFRANKPIIVLSDPKGDTASTARAAGVNTISPLDDTAEITTLLTNFVRQPDAGSLPNFQQVVAASRRARTEQLCELLQSATEG
jgi:glycosyltransferase involved in cell wall biosynthesis